MRRLRVFSGVFIFILSFFTIAETIAQTRKSVSGAEVTGTFRSVSGSEFSIVALGRGKLRVIFSGVYTYNIVNGEPMAHAGKARGEAEIAGDTAAFKPIDTQECTITIKFLPNRRIKVTQKGSDAECGFGHNVSAQGNYKKISNSKPKFPAQ